MRFGIPGWILMIFLLFDFVILNELPMDIKQFNLNLTTLAGMTVIFIGIGIPLGQLIYQVYFFLVWIYREAYVTLLMGFVYKITKIEKVKPVKYFNLEFRWHNALLNIEKNEQREYLSHRYGHLLNRVHELGALLTSIGIVILIQLNLFYVYHNKIIQDSYKILLAIALFSLINFTYFELNLKHFRDRFLKKLENDTAN